MSVGGNPKICPKPFPSVSFDENCKFIKLVKSQEISGVESKDLIESDIDLVEIFKTMYEEKNEDSLDQMMEGNDQIYAPLCSDKEFLNEDWH